MRKKVNLNILSELKNSSVIFETGYHCLIMISEHNASDFTVWNLKSFWSGIVL